MGYGMSSPTMSGGGISGDKIPKGYKAGQLQQFTPQQLQLFQQLFSNVGPESFTSKLAGGDQSAFGQVEAPALRQFGELQGNLASRFSGMGSFGARKSSGFQNTMNQAASSFAQDLQSQRMSYQQQAIKDLMGLSGDLLGQRPYERTLTEKSKPWWQQLLSSAAGGFGEGLGKSAGGGFGSMFTGAAAAGTAPQVERLAPPSNRMARY